MRVMIQNRPRNLPWTGGDQIQEDATARWLESLGVRVGRSTEPEPNLVGYDLVHLFNLIGDWTVRQFRNARRRGVPVVVSTIYNPRQYALASYAEQLEVVRGARMLLPNSRSEREKIEADFGRAAACAIVPNGIEPALLVEPSAAPWKRRDIALFVGRIDERKRALELVRAWRDPRLGGRIPLVLCGHPFLRPYFEEVRAEAEHVNAATRARCEASPPAGAAGAAAGAAAIHFAGEVPPEQLASYYARARVFVLPSRLETPGLANLEAAACGCALVAGECRDVSDYFGDLVRYCDGARPDDIAAKVLEAWESPPDPKLAALVRERYTWEAAARATRDAYRAAFEMPAPNPAALSAASTLAAAS